jgi:hypothetical protein
VILSVIKDRIRKWRVLADDLRTVAHVSKDDKARETLLDPAASYERMADNAERREELREPVSKQSASG